MTIFNSLGSNYSFKDILLTWRELVWPNQKYKKGLKSALSDYFEGKAELLFSGRDAIEYCLKAHGIGKNQTVLTQAFSCSSIEEAIRRTEAQVKYFDLAPDQIMTNLDQIKVAFNQANNPKALILQHSLGYAANVKPIADFCKEKNLILIEDLAQSVGASDPQGIRVGSLADVVILSFGRDKILDGITGGAVIFKDQSIFKFTLPMLKNWFELKSDIKNKKQVLKLLLYPTFTAVIRHTYCLGFGKVLHKLLKKTNVLDSSIISHHHQYQSFPSYFAPLVLNKLNHLPKQLTHRQRIAKYYSQHLTGVSKINLLVNQDLIAHSANLRFPILLKSPSALSSLISHLEKQGIYLGDRWYKSPVDSGSHPFSSQYKVGSCPQAELLSKTVLNLPTHRFIKINSASKIVQAIKYWEKQRN